MNKIEINPEPSKQGGPVYTHYFFSDSCTDDFLSAHSGVKIDGYSGEISGIDWKLLHEKFIDSGGWLDENFKALSVIVKKYQTIITGQYDKKRKARRETTNDVLDRMLREEYARQKQ